MCEPLTEEEKQRDAYEGWKLAIAEKRKRGIRDGSIAPRDEEERIEAWKEWGDVA